MEMTTQIHRHGETSSDFKTEGRPSKRTKVFHNLGDQRLVRNASSANFTNPLLNEKFNISTCSQEEDNKPTTIHERYGAAFSRREQKFEVKVKISTFPIRLPRPQTKENITALNDLVEYFSKYISISSKIFSKLELARLILLQKQRLKLMETMKRYNSKSKRPSYKDRITAGIVQKGYTSDIWLNAFDSDDSFHGRLHELDGFGQILFLWAQITEGKQFKEISKGHDGNLDVDPVSYGNSKFDESMLRLRRFISSWTYVNDEELPLIDAENRVIADAKFYNRACILTANGLLKGQTLQSLSTNLNFYTPIKKTFYGHLMDEMIFVSRALSNETRRKLALARRVIKSVHGWHQSQGNSQDREQKEIEQNLRKLAKNIGNEIRKKWKLIAAIIKARHKEMIAEEKSHAGQRQLNKIFEQSVAVLEEQRATLEQPVGKKRPILGDNSHNPWSNNNFHSSNQSERPEVEEAVLLRREMDMPLEDLLARYNYEQAKNLTDEESNDGTEIISTDDENDDDDDDGISLNDSSGEASDATEEVIDDSDATSILSSSISHNGASSGLYAFSENLREEITLKNGIGIREPTSLNENEKDKKIENFAQDIQQLGSLYFIRFPLRTYQKEGLAWLLSLHHTNVNGILADEMGLGKTIQTISLLGYLAFERGIWGPHLIVVPTSVIVNWEHEFKKWCPGLKILCYHGNQKQRKEKRVGWSKPNSFHVCITSYDLALQDASIFKRRQWNYLILDEAHNIKNFRSNRWQTLITFSSVRRLLLTGTPLQNNLLELWSLLYFLMPAGLFNASSSGISFSNQKDFQEWISQPMEKIIENSSVLSDETYSRIKQLHSILRPYILRRLKIDVEKQLPKKHEHIIRCRLSKRQRFLYDDFMGRSQTKELLSSGNYLSVMNCLMQLRKVCNHPDLFEVRPVMTSFVTTSVISIVLRKLAGIFKMLLSCEYFLTKRNFFRCSGLLFTENEMNLSVSEHINLGEISALNLIQKGLKEEYSANEELQTRAPSSPEYYSLVLNRRYAELKRSMNRLLQLEKSSTRLLYMNGIVYGKWLLEFLRISETEQKVESTRFLKWSCSTDSARSTYKDQYPIECLDALVFAIDHFACISPKVVTTTSFEFEILSNGILSWIFLKKLKDYDSGSGELFHRASTKLRIVFPDKRLLQYDCGKLQTLAILLRQLKAGGHRTLIFTQMTKILDILEIFLNIHGYTYLRLDGSTKVEQRQLLMDHFNNNPKIFVFILSTRSGGVGMNLTGADSVIFYDSDWNPAMDAQAQDRVHRIGQTREVHIYRLVSEHTIEENVLRKADQKKLLDELVTKKGEFTLDHLRRITWKDWIKEDELETQNDTMETLNLEKKTQSEQNQMEWEKAMELVEDESDAKALQFAKKEQEIDLAEFRETERSPSVQVDETKVMSDQYATPVEVRGSIEGYMLRYYIWEVGFYFMDWKDLLSRIYK